MSDEHTNQAQSERTLDWHHPTSIFTLLMLMSLFTFFGRRVLEHFSWFERFENRVGYGITLLLLTWASIPILYLFRRRQRRMDKLRFREDFLAGRLRRMSFAARSAFMLISLGCIVTGLLIEDGAAFVLLAGPVFLLSVLEELNIILRPGDHVRPNPRDELLAFFRQRTLQVGYFVAIASLGILGLVSLFATRYVRALLPVGLTISLLAPSLFYSLMDRRAGADE